MRWDQSGRKGDIETSEAMGDIPRRRLRRSLPPSEERAVCPGDGRLIARSGETVPIVHATGLDFGAQILAATLRDVRDRVARFHAIATTT